MKFERGRITCSQINELENKIIFKNNDTIYAPEFNEFGNINMPDKIENGDIIITSQGIFCKEFVEI